MSHKISEEIIIFILCLHYWKTSFITDLALCANYSKYIFLAQIYLGWNVSQFTDSVVAGYCGRHYKKAFAN